MNIATFLCCASSLFLPVYFLGDFMKKFIAIAIICLFSIGINAQTETKPKVEPKPAATPDVKTPTVDAKETLGKVEIKADASSVELVKNAVKAHGGDAFKNMKTLFVSGACDFSVEGSTFSLTASFITAFAGEKYRIELNNPVQPFKQSFDGTNTYSAGGQGLNLPPLNRVGLPLLQRFDEKGFSISSLPDDKKKKKGFRITSPEGYVTDFFIDDKTGQIKGYEASYEINGSQATTSVEIDKLRLVEGVQVPEKYSQRLQFGSNFVVYAAFKAKDILVNTKLADELFAAPKN
jgi:hypothetical protein